MYIGQDTKKLHHWYFGGKKQKKNLEPLSKKNFFLENKQNGSATEQRLKKNYSGESASGLL